MFHSKSFMSAFVLSVGLYLASLGWSPGLVQAAQGVDPVGTWTGTEVINGVPSPVAFRLFANGVAIMADSSGTHNGTYTRQGNVVTMNITSINWVYLGTINGNTMTGGGRSGDNGQTSAFRVFKR